MMRRYALAAIAALTIASIAAPSAAAQDALDVAAARRLVLGNSAALGKAALAVETAVLAERAQAYAGMPSVGASASGSLAYDYSGSGSDALGAAVKLSATQTVFDGGRQSATLKRASLASEEAREAMRAVRLDLIGQADSAFYAALKAALSVEAAADDLAAARLRLRIAKAKADSGALAKSDYLMTESETAGYETSLIKAERTLASARARLASITGVRVGAALEPIDFSAYDGLLLRLSALDDSGAEALSAGVAALAADGNPELAGYAIAARKADLSVRAAAAGYLPTVTAGLSQGVDWTDGDGLSLGDAGISVSVSLDLDLWTTRNSVRSASAAADSAALDVSDGSRNLLLDIDVAVNELLGAGRTIASSAKALEYAESNYDNALERFRLSSASASDLSGAEALVSVDRTALISARYDFLSCLSTLRGLAGLESEDAILALVP
ncbi:MAG: hypothetical protein CVV47_12050 [Spirochaetae bacterium HGW-Spirochaetae-3]|jgi:outer membrane protein|nr:MAG: hypothetical protein CVV47_12050 [Spirochaetae bacterium HGW-Spirochaetae-3]